MILAALIPGPGLREGGSLQTGRKPGSEPTRHAAIEGAPAKWTRLFWIILKSTVTAAQPRSKRNRSETSFNMMESKLIKRDDLFIRRDSGLPLSVLSPQVSEDSRLGRG
jgi:hypothetical protein